MPHIHTEPNQHDMTVSAYIIRPDEKGDWLCLVHMHKKIDMLMQVGGHIELNQTPWQAMATELREEAGYELLQLEVLQPFSATPKVTDAAVHPAPLVVNTHDVGNSHYHSDMCFGFVAKSLPEHATAENESDDVRWLSLPELVDAGEAGIALTDTVDIYQFLLDNLGSLHTIPAQSFVLTKPVRGLTYKR